ncbi:heme exporter protein CcmB [Simiduia agarivorans]|uniref:Heme exporter protein B n=1 Tax=Simiduia agarivorans (strain DSM 21679 / JCM 13881 / BCRC 17597 / SA1) TaxID=1117647 RepID=K4KEE6_SIMAS|nr:heme exporter protein CcmB [Simiduia agarivorans]AFU97286.1 UDP-2,3-diacylglucosamine hydrolase [Simiduia agarivorans SA1 = DSM 21679]
MTESLGTALGRQFSRELKQSVRASSEWANPVIFFVMVITMVPIGISPDAKLLAVLAPGMIWVVALLATLLSLDGLFRTDRDDGSLEQLLISPHPLPLLVMTKVMVHWLVTGLPLTLLSPVLGMMLSLPAEGYVPLVLSLLIGTGSLSFIGAIGAALTVSLRRGGLLIALIIMPFYVPVLIFGANGVSRAIEGFAHSGQLAVLGAFLALSVALAPFAIAAGLRISADS